MLRCEPFSRHIINSIASSYLQLTYVLLPIGRGTLFTAFYRVRTISALHWDVDKGQLIFGTTASEQRSASAGRAATVNEST